MTLVMGVGQAGSNIVAEMLDVPRSDVLLEPYLVNSTTRDMVPHLDDIPTERWLGVKEKEGLIPLGAMEGGEEERVSGGMGKDPRRCHDALTDAYTRVRNTLDGLDLEVPIRDQRFAVLVFAGGGGTGAGAAPVIADAIRDLSEGTCRVLGVMVLPASSRGEDVESGALREAWNAAFSLDESLDVFDGLILADNQRLSHLGDIERGFPDFNAYIARCLTDVILGNFTEFAVPETEDLVLQQSDVQDLATSVSLGDGRPGVASIGRVVELLHGPLGYMLPFLPEDRPDLVSLNILAEERLTVEDGDVDSYEKAYVLVRSPETVFNRPGFGEEVNEVLHTIARKTRRDEVLYGTALTERPVASLTTIRTYDPEGLPRIDRLREEAERYEEVAESA